MLIKVIPSPPWPSPAEEILFNVTFLDIDDNLNLPTPMSWTNQIQVLQHDELELPRTLHCLDKAVGILSLLNEVSFNVPTMTISCKFVDGLVEEWPLVGDNCLDVLEDVAYDVNQATLEEAREEEWVLKREEEKERKRVEAISPPPPIKLSRHKKQRSLLMTLVASILPSSLSLSSSCPSSRLPSPPPTPASERPPSSLNNARARRRRARSAMVDTLRRYALTELSRRFPLGGYYTWIVQSMLRRATSHMEQLVHQVGGSSPDPVVRFQREESEFFSITAASLPPSPCGSDDEGCGNEDTDTDGSSVHTPSSSHFNTSRQNAYPIGYFRKHHNYVSNSPRRYLSENDHAMYTELAGLTGRLRRLLIQEESRQKHVSEEIKHQHTILEIRGRRRAWLNKALVGGVRNENTDIGMAMPFKSSPLARRSWSCDDYEYAPNPEELTYPVEEYDEYDKLDLLMARTRRSPGTTLFPVCEEDDDDQDDARELELHFQGFGIDLEGGVNCIEDEEEGGGVRVAFEVERPQIRPRARTNSMYKHRVDPPTPMEITLVSAPGPQQLKSSSLLCQPFSVEKPHEVVDIEQPPVYAELDISVRGLDVGEYGACDKYADEEFTLSMDLPFNVRTQDRDVFPSRKEMGVDDDHGWIPSGISESDSLHCR